MRVDESDPELLALLRGNSALFPEWSPPDPVAGTEPTCSSGFGAVIDDAEDASGREWDVIIERDGKRRQASFRNPEAPEQ